MKRFAFLMTLTIALSGCAGKSSINDFRVSLGFVSAYEAAVDEFKQGQVIEARTRLKTIKKGHSDYKNAQTFLTSKVEPARLKLLRYYAKKGKKEESQKKWAQAEEAYKTAAGLSIKPKALLDYQKNMSLKVRQLRADEIYAQRQKEDEEWLKWQSGYNPPKGLLGDDEIFTIARNDLMDAFDKRMAQTWILAEKYKRMDMPEMAWVYAESYLRFKPESKKAQDLKNAMATAVPKGFRLGLPSSQKGKSQNNIGTSRLDTSASSASVKALMKKGLWLKAKREALALRRTGDANADKLLEEIQVKVADLAQKAYSDGNLAFRQEKIDQAVDSWREAVNLMPNEQLYVESLRRGVQIQERLAALKTEESESEREARIEE